MTYKTIIINHLNEQIKSLEKDKPCGWKTNYNLYQKIIPYFENEKNIFNMNDVVMILRKSGMKLTGEKYPWKSKLLKLIDKLFEQECLISSSESDSDSDNDNDSNKDLDIDRIYTVSDINLVVKNTISSIFNNLVEVTGEISNLSRHNGNIYLSLKDQSSRIRGIIWRSVYKNNKEIKNGDKIIVKGRLDTYQKNGEYQLIIYSFREKGEGNHLKKFNDLKKIFENKGYFSNNFKKPIPKWISNIGIISSVQAAGFGDILHKIRSINKWVNIYLISTSVQGNDASKEIIAAIDRYHMLTSSQDLDLDVIVITRGGGSVEDLQSYNDPNLVEKIFNSKIPIATGIGHEKDISLCDLVSDYHAITPTAAGEKITVSTDDTHLLFKSLVSDFKNKIKKNIDHHKFKLSKTKDYCFTYLNSILVDYKIQIRNKINLKINNSLKILFSKKERINQYFSIDLFIKNLYDIKYKYNKHLHYLVDNNKMLVNNYKHTLISCDPEFQHKKGFCLIESQGKLVDTLEKFNKCRETGSKINIYFGNKQKLTISLS